MNYKQDEDIENVMLFMEMAFIFDNPVKSFDEHKNAYLMQQLIISLLSGARSNRMKYIHELLKKVYNMNEQKMAKYEQSMSSTTAILATKGAILATKGAILATKG